MIFYGAFSKDSTIIFRALGSMAWTTPDIITAPKEEMEKIAQSANLKDYELIEEKDVPKNITNLYKFKRVNTLEEYLAL